MPPFPAASRSGREREEWGRGMYKRAGWGNKGTLWKEGETKKGGKEKNGVERNGAIEREKRMEGREIILRR